MSHRARILFVDDEERIVNLLKISFRTEYEVHVATGAEQALDIMRRVGIDVIVSDQRMPGMSGTELLGQVRECSPRTVRLLLTGYSDLAAIVGSVNEGEVYRFINKPWQHEDLKATIAEAVDVARRTAIAEPAAALLEALVEANEDAGVERPEILLIDDSEEDRRQVVPVLSAHHRVHEAGSIRQALDLLSRRNIGVIIADAFVNSESVSPMLKILKREFPLIMVVMLTRKADSDAVIKLINQARIYRFAIKPARASVVELAVRAALREHNRCRADSRLLAHQGVSRSEEVEHPSLIQNVLKSLGFLRQRLGMSA